MLVCAAKGYCQNFTVTYDFGSVTTTSGRTDPTPVPTATGVSFGNFTAVAPAGNPNALGTNPNAAARFSFIGWPTGAINASDVFTGSINNGQYYQVTISPQTHFSISFSSVTFTVQRSGTGIRQYAVRSSADSFSNNLPASVEPANASLQVVADNVFQVSDASTAAQDGSKVTLTGLSSITGPVTFRFYGWNAEAQGGTFSIDNVRFTGSAIIEANTPDITLSTGTLSFPVTNTNATAALTYTVKADFLTGPLDINTTAPFTVSDAESGSYSTSLSIPAADVVTPKTIYVHFSPVATGMYNSVIANSSTGATTKNITVTGEANDPNNLNFNFNSCSAGGAPGSGFQSYSVRGAQQWGCSNFGLNGTHGVDMNGYSGSAVDNEDWLISPALLIGSLNLPILRFWSRGEFTGPSLQLLVSTDYDGSSNPNNATWTDLQANFPPLTNMWTLTDGINLGAYKSGPKVYIAFKYTSSAELGAARWTVDSIDVTDRSTLLSAGSAALDFGEVTAGAQSGGLPVTVQAVGYNDITATAPAGYQLSADNVSFGSAILLPNATTQAGITLFVRFSPASKQLKITGSIRFTGSGLDSSLIMLTGSSYPKAETFDVAAYNLSFFGSNANNNPTQEKINTQINNIATVLQRLNMDVVGVEEISNDTAFAQLLGKLPGYAAVVSNRWSYSFEPPDPNFPPQKTGFIYNTATMQLVEDRVMFTGLYDSARNGTTHVLDNYPTGTPSSFWASGRLPHMVTFNVTVNGKTRQVRLIDIHAKSASDVASYNRRVYDAKVLKDSLDAYYKYDNIILVGDFNDRLSGSINAGAQSPYKPFIDDITNYTGLTLPLDQAGKVSFLSGAGLIDHIVISNEMQDVAISNATDIEDPRTYISSYNATTASDHLPVFTRFNLSLTALPVQLSRFQAQISGSAVVINWLTANEVTNSYFIVERSKDGSSFVSIARLNARSSAVNASYQTIDSFPLQGASYYRLKQVDIDGRINLSQTVSVNIGAVASGTINIYPNPVNGIFNLHVPTPAIPYSAQIMSADGRPVLHASGDVHEINLQINRQMFQLKSGMYILQLSNAGERHALKFIKK